MGLDQRPFSIRHVTGIAQIFPPILLPSGFSPHLVSPMLSDTAWVSQTAEIAQFISGQALRSGRNFPIATVYHFNTVKYSVFSQNRLTIRASTGDSQSSQC